MRIFTLRLPSSLHRGVKELAQREGVSMNQIIGTAVAEKLSALMTEDYLEERVARGSQERFEAVLERASRLRFEEVLRKVPRCGARREGSAGLSRGPFLAGLQPPAWASRLTKAPSASTTSPAPSPAALYGGSPHVTSSDPWPSRSSNLQAKTSLRDY